MTNMQFNQPFVTSLGKAHGEQLYFCPFLVPFRFTVLYARDTRDRIRRFNRATKNGQNDHLNVFVRYSWGSE